MTWNVRDHFREDIQHEDPEHVAAWHDWFARHGIDPAEVLLTHWVERRASEHEHMIVWLTDGERDGVPITVHREIHLEQDPEPFPVP